MLPGGIIWGLNGSLNLLQIILYFTSIIFAPLIPMCIAACMGQMCIRDRLTPSRRRRIANGSGNSFVDVNKFIKDFNQSKQLMQGVLSGDMSKMMKQMGLNRCV